MFHAWILCPRLTSTEEFLRVNPATPLTRIRGFSPWRFWVQDGFFWFNLLWFFLIWWFDPKFRKLSLLIFALVHAKKLRVVSCDLWAKKNKHVQGIYPDLLHILDLALLCDMYSSSYLHWTDDQTIFEGRSRDERLLKLYKMYVKWCEENRDTVLT